MKELITLLTTAESQLRAKAKACLDLAAVRASSGDSAYMRHAVDAGSLLAEHADSIMGKRALVQKEVTKAAKEKECQERYEKAGKLLRDQD